MRWKWLALMARLMGGVSTCIHPNSPVWWKELDPCGLVFTHLKRKDAHPHTTPLFTAFHLTYTLYGQGDLGLMEAPLPLVVIIVWEARQVPHMGTLRSDGRGTCPCPSGL